MQWIILMLMTSVLSAVLAVLLVRRFDAWQANRTSGIAVHRDRIAEAAGRQAAGQIDGAQGSTTGTQVEPQRHPAEAGQAPSAPLLPFGMRKVAAIAVMAVVALGSGLYAFNGSPDLLSMTGVRRAVGAGEISVVDQLALASGQMFATEPPRAGSPAAEPALGPSPGMLASVDEMIDRLAERLKRNANDPEGWRMLGWSYLRTERFAESAAAYAKAVQLSPNVASMRSAWGEALVKAAGGVVTPESKAVFEQALVLDPKDIGARYFVALAEAQAGDKRAALDAWLKLLDGADPKEPWVADIAQSATDVAREIGVDVSARVSRLTPGAAGGDSSPSGSESRGTQNRDASSRGPSEEDIRNAEKMPPDERIAMIRGMVEGLANRLQQSPRDADGWIKLIRSRSVLGESEIARQELGKALNVFSDAPQEQTRIEAVARQLGLTR